MCFSGLLPTKTHAFISYTPRLQWWWWLSCSVVSDSFGIPWTTALQASLFMLPWSAQQQRICLWCRRPGSISGLGRLQYGYFISRNERVKGKLREILPYFLRSLQKEWTLADKITGLWAEKKSRGTQANVWVWRSSSRWMNRTRPTSIHQPPGWRAKTLRLGRCEQGGHLWTLPSVAWKSAPVLGHYTIW